MNAIFSEFSPAGVSSPRGRQPVSRAVNGGFAAANNGGFPAANNTGSGRSPDSGGGMARRRRPRRNRRGLIGMLLSIVVAVVIVIAIFAVYNQLTASANAAQTAIFVRQLAPQIANQYRGNYRGLNNQAAIRSGFVPDNWYSGTTIKDPDGAAVTIATAATPVPANSTFTVTFGDGVPPQTCKAVLGALKSDPRYVSVKVGAAGAVRASTQSDIDTECAKEGDFVVKFR